MEYLTLLFINGDAGLTIPLGKSTPWGQCVAASVENVFAERDLLENAVNYALDVSTDGADWLRDWMRGDADAKAELAEWLAAGN